MENIVAPILNLAALAVGSHRALTAWIAVSQLPPPPPAETKAVVQETTTAQTPPTWTRRVFNRFFNRKSIKGTIFIVTFLTIEALIIFGLPRISSQFFIDTFWLVLMGFCCSTLLYSVITIVHQSPQTVEYHRAKSDSPVQLKYTPVDQAAAPLLSKPIIRIALACTITGVIFASDAIGKSFGHPLLAAAWVVNFTRTFTPPKVVMKRVVQLLLAIEFLLPALVAILVPILMYFFDKDKTDDKPEEPVEENKMTFPSEWISSIMVIITQAYPVIFPAILVALNLRFDYSLAKAPISLPTTESETKTTKIQVPLNIPEFTKPHFFTSLSALAVSSISAKLIPAILGYKNTKDDFSMIAMFITIPATLLASVGAAWYTGNLTAWWGYSEVWIPKPTGNVNENEIDDVEKVLGGDVVPPQEKAAI